MGSGGRDAGAVSHASFVMGERPGAIVAGFDVHRRQITVDALDTVTGEVSRGQIESTPVAVEEWVAGFPGRVVHVAVEACTGRLFVCRALERCGSVVYLAEPVETSALRGRKRGAKTDRTVWIGNFVPNLSRAASIVFCHSGRLRRTIVELSLDHGAWSRAAVSIDLKPNHSARPCDHAIAGCSADRLTAGS